MAPNSEGDRSVSDRVALVRAGVDAFTNGDPEFVISRLASNCVWEENQLGGFPGLDPVYVGPSGFQKWMDDTREAWLHMQAIATDVIEMETPEGPSFVVELRLAARGQHDVEVDWILFNVLWARDDLTLVRRRVYFDRDEALAAAAIPNSEIAAAEPAT